jgi:hypothetical protein
MTSMGAFTCAGSQDSTSEHTHSARCRRSLRRAWSSISAEESTPTMRAWGHRRAKERVREPGPQPRSTTISGVLAPTLKVRSANGRSRSLLNFAYCSGSHVSAEAELSHVRHLRRSAAGRARSRDVDKGLLRLPAGGQLRRRHKGCRGMTAARLRRRRLHRWCTIGAPPDGAVPLAWVCGRVRPGSGPRSRHGPDCDRRWCRCTRVWRPAR